MIRRLCVGGDRARLRAAVKNQKYEDLFVNSHGVMFGSGEVWVNGLCKDNACKTLDVKVITIQHAH